ncbi:MAG: 2-amino-4-hydroxy-6-hydroxymethyldihydropteridine diphosphokinase [Psychromonas sp.]|nr:2-amino-4-hydroxy-6-hydroxymethyldihydropteridine diphosphokinase [Psychromonas sp.]
MISYIAIGSNQDDPIKQLALAICAMDKIANTSMLAQSSFYYSTPMGPQDQPDYVNAVVKIKTNLLPLKLLDKLQKIEISQGRIRKKERWASRNLDLDILLCDDLIINHPRLTVPHYGMKVRAFVLYPLFEIDENIKLPDGSLASQLLTKCDLSCLTKICPIDHVNNHTKPITLNLSSNVIQKK